MGEVWLAVDERLDRRVAVKLLRDEQRLRPGARERLLREARALGRVDHPAICQIHDILELGELDALVLEYVEGKTLAQTDLESLSFERKVDLAARIAEALSVAHRHGVIHRDLKAENVMLTPDGGLKVLDFGVARLVLGEELAPLDSSKASHAAGETLELDAPAPLPDAEAFVTRRGVIVGTLHAMSPEQARGEAVTAATDLFSLGLLIQELFTGKPAYPLELEPRALYQLVTAGTPLAREGLDPDLDRLVGELLQLEPERRPPAAQVAERLRWIAAKPARLAERRRKRRLALFGFAGLTLALVVVSYLAWTASRARDLATRRQAQAEDLINFLLNDLKPRLEEVGRLELLDQVASRARAYFSALSEAELSESERARRIDALRLVAEILIARGRLEEAESTLQEALGALPAGKQRQGQDSGLAHLATSKVWTVLGALRIEDPDPARREQALGRLERALEAARASARLLPDDGESQLRLVEALGDLGVALYSTGRYEEAVERLTDAAAQARLWLERYPDRRPEALGSFASQLGWLSTAHYQLGRLEEALRIRSEQVEQLRSLVSKEPGNRTFLNDLAVAESYLGQLLEARGRIREAVAVQDEVVQVFEQLVAFEPENVDWRRNLAVGRFSLGQFLLHLGQPEEGRRHLTEAVSDLVRLTQESPDLKIWPRMEAVFRLRLARAEQLLGRTAEVEQQLAIARERLARFREGDPSRWESLLSLAVGLLEWTELALPRAGASAARSHDAEEALVALSNPNSLNNPRNQDMRARLLLALGRTEEARPIVLRLVGTGWAAPEFVETVRNSPLRDLLYASSAEGP